MKNTELKHIVGKVEANQPAIIRFFGAVDEYSTRQFNDEFLWLQDYVKPSKIIVMINSEGGSVIHGMGTFSIIQSCPIEVDCIVCGIAASMGSVLWAAGDNLYMHDYSLLMIHNPFNAYADNNDKNNQAVIEAFKNQLRAVYKSRFGLDDEKIEDVMDGEEGVDGTFMSADVAVKNGFLKKKNIIITDQKTKDKVKNDLQGINDACSIRDIMSSISASLDKNKLIEAFSTIHHKQDTVKKTQYNTMEDNKTLTAVLSCLGFTDDDKTTKVTARIKELLQVEKALEDVNNTVADMKIKLKGKDTELENVNSQLNELKAELKEYHDAEKAQLEAEIENVVDAAIKDGKISEDARASWIDMAHQNFETVKATLNSITGREDISSMIANDDKNKNDIEGALKSAEEKANEAIKAKVKQICGDFEFESFNA